MTCINNLATIWLDNAGGEACFCSNLMCQHMCIPHWNHYWLGGIEVSQAGGGRDKRRGERENCSGMKNKI